MTESPENPTTDQPFASQPEAAQAFAADASKLRSDGLPPPEGAQSIWERIKEHKLIQWALAYVGAGLALAHGQELVAHAFGWPEIVGRLLIGALALGLPVVLTLAWYHGHKGAKQFSAGEMSILALLILIIAGGLYVFVRVPVEHEPRGATLPKEENVAARAGGRAAPRPTEVTPAASLAVLAFDNMSGNQENEYFSDGISEELLNDLSQVPGLRVAARTSAFSFKGKNASIADIAKALNVRAVVEGSVRRAGNRVRITAQLINAADGFHMWSQDYDRDLADIFAVQDEIAHAITKELTGRLLPAPGAGSTTAKAKVNPDAFTAYLQGRFFLAKRNKPDMLRAVDFFKHAIALEPNWADAHASLGQTFARLYSNGQSADVLQAAKDEAATALRLDPDNVQALMLKGIANYSSWNWLEAESALQKAVKLSPNDAESLHSYSEFLSWLGFQEAALAAERKASTLDPLAPVIRHDIGTYLYRLNRLPESVAAYQVALTLDPNFVFSMRNLCIDLADLGKFEDAKRLLNTRLVAADGENGPETDRCRLFLAARSGDTKEMKRLTSLTTRLHAKGERAAVDVAWAFAQAGDLDQAIAWYDKTYIEHNVRLFVQIASPDFPAKLKADPRWKAFMQRPLLQDWQAARTRIAAEFATGK